MENVMTNYLNFGEFNRKPSHDLKTHKNLYNEEYRIRHQSHTNKNNQYNQKDKPILITNKIVMGLSPRIVHNQNTVNYDMNNESFISKNYSKISEQNSKINRNLDKRHVESKYEIDKMPYDKLNVDKRERRNQSKISENTKKNVDIMNYRELKDISRTERFNQAKTTSPKRIYNKSLKKQKLYEDEKIISTKIFHSKHNKDHVDLNRLIERPDSAITKENRKLITTKPSYKEIIDRNYPGDPRRRPASHDTRKKNENFPNKVQQIKNRDNITEKDKKNYKDSSHNKAIEAILKLHEFYSDNKKNDLNYRNINSNNTQIKHYNSTKLFIDTKTEESKKLFAKIKDKKEAVPIRLKTYHINEKTSQKQVGEFSHKNKNENHYPDYQKNLPLPVEKNFNLNIDFNQLDQFSPPSNQNMPIGINNNIYEYNNTLNKANEYTARYGAVDLNEIKRNPELITMENNNVKNKYKFSESEKRKTILFNKDLKVVDSSIIKNNLREDFKQDNSYKSYLNTKLIKTKRNDKLNMSPSFAKRK